MPPIEEQNLRTPLVIIALALLTSYGELKSARPVNVVVQANDRVVKTKTSKTKIAGRREGRICFACGLGVETGTENMFRKLYQTTGLIYREHISVGRELEST